jgi:PAS domain S-box-containing protein
VKTISEIKKVEDIPAVIVNEEGFITYINPAFEKCFGWELSELTGKTLTVIIPENLHDAHNMGFSRFLATGKPTLLGKPLTLRSVTKEGVEFDAEHYIVAEKIDGHWIFGATVKRL